MREQGGKKEANRPSKRGFADQHTVEDTFVASGCCSLPQKQAFAAQHKLFVVVISSTETSTERPRKPMPLFSPF